MTACAVVSLLPPIAGTASAQRKDVRLNRRTQDVRAQAPSPLIPLRSEQLPPCEREDCVRASVDQFGQDKGLKFGYVPTAQPLLAATICPCGVKVCDGGE